MAPRPRKHSSRLAGWIVKAAWIVTGFVVIAVAGFPIYVSPRVDQLREADAVLILGGNGYARYPYGMGLADSGWASNLVISTPIGSRDVWIAKQCAEPRGNVKVYCFKPDPLTTAGEAMALRRLANEHGWKSVIVVTFTPHISRARFILEQCFEGDLIMVASPTQVSFFDYVYQYLYQSAGFLKAMLNPAC